MDAQTDRDLVELARQGDKAAFGVLVERYLPMITRLARRMVREADVAHDLAQEAVLAAFLSLEQLRDAGSFRSWIYGITLNVCRAWQLGNGRAEYSLEAMTGGLHREPRDHDASPEEIAERLELWRVLLEAVQALSPPNRAAVMLVYYEERSLREAADLLGISLNALKGRLHKSRLMLQRKLCNQLEVTDDIGGNKMISVKVVDVRRSEIMRDSGIPAVSTQIVLHDEAGQRALVFWAGEAEGMAILHGLMKPELPRPLTFMLAVKLLQAAGATVESVTINALHEDVYYATVKVQSGTGTGTQEIDARPSDAIALALQANAPIFVSDEVMAQAAVRLPEGQAPTGRGIAEAMQYFERQRQTWEAHRAKQQSEKLEQEQNNKREIEEILRMAFSSNPQY